MDRTFIAIVSLVLATGAWNATGGEANKLTREEKAAGWQSLFDGQKPGKQWRAYNGDQFPDEWTVEDGWLVCPGSGGDIISREQFQSFELKLEFKLEEGGNSGVFYRAIEQEGPIWHSGPEYQLLDRGDNNTAPYAVGALYDLIAPDVDATRPAGEVNQVRIRLDGNRLTHFLNGQKLLSVTIGGKRWNEVVEESKFAPMEFFGNQEIGHIGLQDHGDRVVFRNIKIRELPQNTLDTEERAAGWRLLFDGEAPRKQWREYNGESLPEGWHAEDGWLVCKGDGGGDLITREQFGSFELSLEWTFRKEEGGNSGIFYRVTEQDAPAWHSGPEYQLLDDPGDPLSRFATASHYELFGPVRDATRPSGAVNSSRIVVDGNRVVHYLNGRKVVETEMHGDKWQEALGDSKFVDMPTFAAAPQGHIALQDHGDWVAFRNIKIRPIE